MSKINDSQLKQLLEAAIFVNESPLSIDKMRNTILSELAVSSRQLNTALAELALDYAPRGIKLVKVASGYRFQSDTGLGQLLSRLWQENVPKYSRAMLETLALIAYKQPITRGEIEDIRGVTVSSNIIRSLTERQWIKVVGPSAEAFTANIEAAVQASSQASIELEKQGSHAKVSSKEVVPNEATNTENLPKETSIKANIH
jgi:segregation and condensation protein B